MLLVIMHTKFHTFYFLLFELKSIADAKNVSYVFRIRVTLPTP